MQTSDPINDHGTLDCSSMNLFRLSVGGKPGEGLTKMLYHIHHVCAGGCRTYEAVQFEIYWLAARLNLWETVVMAKRTARVPKIATE